MSAITTATALTIAGVATAGAGVVGSAIASNQQGKATDKATAATSDAAANSLAFNRDVYNDTQANEAPYRAVGEQAVGQLGAGLADGSLTRAYPGGPFSFTGVDLLNDPAYKFNLDQGTQAMQRSQAAQGGLISGGAQRDLNDYAQGYAGNQYQQSYQNALAAYQLAYGQFEAQQGNEFSRLNSVAGLGQNAVTQTATSGTNAANANANVNTSTANTLADLYTGQANAQGAGTIAATNQITGGINQYANSLAQQSGSSYGTSMTPYKPTYAVDPRTGI